MTPRAREQAQGRQRVGVEAVAGPRRRRALDAEDLPDVRVRLAAGGEPAEDAHQREARNPRGVRGALPERRLVEQRLADVEHDGPHSHDATSSRSAGEVTLTSRGSPSTALIRPPWASTSGGAVGSLARQQRGGARPRGTPAASATRRALRGRASRRPRPARRASRCPPREAPAPHRRSPRTAARSRGRAPRRSRAVEPRRARRSRPPRRESPRAPLRTEPARVSPPVTTDRTFPAASSSASTITGSSQPGGAATMMPSIQSESSRRRSGSATSGRLPSRANAFGRSSPSRSPRPAAARTAHTLTLCGRAGLRLGRSTPSSPSPPSSSSCRSFRSCRSWRARRRASRRRPPRRGSSRT